MGTIAVALTMAFGHRCHCATAGAAAPLMLFFDWGKPDIRSDDQAVLDRAVTAWRASRIAPAPVRPHRPVGQRPSTWQHRARRQMVRDELVRGVPAGSISVAAYGEERPLVPTEDGVREVQNRRVEIIVSQ
jgi:outer membrane protein OmpA-like peptidoglycan-associated protein